MNVMNISNTSISYNEETRKSSKLLLSNGNAQFQTVLNKRLVDRTMRIDAPIKKSNYKLPRTTNDVVKVEKKKLIYAHAILNKL